MNLLFSFQRITDVYTVQRMNVLVLVLVLVHGFSELLIDGGAPDGLYSSRRVPDEILSEI